MMEKFPLSFRKRPSENLTPESRKKLDKMDELLIWKPTDSHMDKARGVVQKHQHC